MNAIYSFLTSLPGDAQVIGVRIRQTKQEQSAQVIYSHNGERFTINLKGGEL